jgi:hypothetical protein
MGIFLVFSRDFLPAKTPYESAFLVKMIFLSNFSKSRIVSKNGHFRRFRQNKSKFPLWNEQTGASDKSLAGEHSRSSEGLACSIFARRL